jgi:hypothetical protein
MTAVRCDRCGAELNQPGALVFGVPFDTGGLTRTKRHVCVTCYDSLIDWFRFFPKPAPQQEAS